MKKETNVMFVKITSIWIIMDIVTIKFNIAKHTLAMFVFIVRILTHHLLEIFVNQIVSNSAKND